MATDVTHRLLQLLIATALTGHIPGGRAFIDTIASNMQPQPERNTEDELESGARMHASWCLPFSRGSEYLRSFFRIDQLGGSEGPEHLSESLPMFEASLLGAPLELVITSCTSLQDVCATTAGMPSRTINAVLAEPPTRLSTCRPSCCSNRVVVTAGSGTALTALTRPTLPCSYFLLFGGALSFLAHRSSVRLPIAMMTACVAMDGSFAAAWLILAVHYCFSGQAPAMNHGSYASALLKIQGCLTSEGPCDNAEAAGWAANTFSTSGRQTEPHAEVLVAGALVDMIAAMTYALCYVPTEDLAQAQTCHALPSVGGHDAAQMVATSDVTWLQTHEQSQVCMRFMPQLHLNGPAAAMSTDVQAADMALATIAMLSRQFAESSFRSNDAACNASIPVAASTLHWSISHASPGATARFLRALGTSGWLEKLPAACEPHPWASSLLWNLQSEAGLQALARAVAEASSHGEDNALWGLITLLDRTLRCAGMTPTDSGSHVPVHKSPCEIVLAPPKHRVAECTTPAPTASWFQHAAHLLARLLQDPRRYHLHVACWWTSLCRQLWKCVSKCSQSFRRCGS